MQVDLFSSLDNSSSVLFWGPFMIALLAILPKSFTLNNFSLSIFNKTQTKPPKNITIFSVTQLALFILILWVNFFGLMPLTYGFSTSIWFAVSLSFSLWLMLILSSATNNIKKTMAHFAPSGTPVILIPLLVIIETISVLIRPITLAVRLIANISAGHIIMSLIAVCCNSYFYLGFIQVLYMLFEFFVVFIQSYIFTLLISIYLTEHS
uniref:ATP synthase F0 subunit 6 n=1 Tax=Eleutherocaulis alte TaxID=74076 RepID=UPI0023D89FFF|nr:ATP synthase F0 subunit 6 [Eleutherocaulis alte]WDD39308.1 ATP synthase F0 subunit 6 [Eleutherocaulis alte]